MAWLIHCSYYWHFTPCSQVCVLAQCITNRWCSLTAKILNINFVIMMNNVSHSYNEHFFVDNSVLYTVYDHHRHLVISSSC